MIPGLEAGAPAVAAAAERGPDPATLQELVGLAVSATGLRGGLTRVAELAEHGLVAVEAVSVLLGPPGEPWLLVTSSVGAQSGDGLQFGVQAGPSFDAYASGRSVRSPDMTRDPRWPALTGEPGADARRGCWARPLHGTGPAAGVMTFYSGHPEEDGPGSVWAELFARRAEALLVDGAALTEAETAREQMQEALHSRAAIDQAKGIIMLVRRCDPDEAFKHLVKLSNTSQRKVRDIAQDIVARAATGF